MNKTKKMRIPVSVFAEPAEDTWQMKGDMRTLEELEVRMGRCPGSGNLFYLDIP